MVLVRVFSRSSQNLCCNAGCSSWPNGSKLSSHVFDPLTASWSQCCFEGSSRAKMADSERYPISILFLLSLFFHLSRLSSICFVLPAISRFKLSDVQLQRHVAKLLMFVLSSYRSSPSSCSSRRILWLVSWLEPVCLPVCFVDQLAWRCSLLRSAILKGQHGHVQNRVDPRQLDDSLGDLPQDGKDI